LLLYNAPGGMLNAPVHDGLSPSEPIQPWTGWAGPFSELESFYAIRRSGPVRTVAASHFWKRLHRTFAKSGTGDSCHSGREGRYGGRPNGHRENRQLCVAPVTAFGKWQVGGQ